MDFSPALERERSITPPPKLASVVISTNKSTPATAQFQSKTSVFDRIGVKTARIPKLGKTEQKRRVYKQALRTANEPSKNGIPSLFSLKLNKPAPTKSVQQPIPALLPLKLKTPQIKRAANRPNPKKRLNPHMRRRAQALARKEKRQRKKELKKIEHQMHLHQMNEWKPPLPPMLPTPPPMPLPELRPESHLPLHMRTPLSLRCEIINRMLDHLY
jgi:hypothetical protein